MKKKYQNYSNGYSLIEMLVVMFIFAILAVVVTQSLAITLRTTSKGDNIANIKQEVGYAISVMEYNLRTGTNLTCDTRSSVSYTDQWGNLASFSIVVDDSGIGRIASNSATMFLTSDSINLVSPNIFNSPCDGAVEITIQAEDATSLGAEGSAQTFTTLIVPRNQ